MIISRSGVDLNAIWGRQITLIESSSDDSEESLRKSGHPPVLRRFLLKHAKASEAAYRKGKAWREANPESEETKARLRLHRELAAKQAAHERKVADAQSQSQALTASLLCGSGFLLGEGDKTLRSTGRMVKTGGPEDYDRWLSQRVRTGDATARHIQAGRSRINNFVSSFRQHKDLKDNLESATKGLRSYFSGPFKNRIDKTRRSPEQQLIRNHLENRSRASREERAHYPSKDEAIRGLQGHAEEVDLSPHRLVERHVAKSDDEHISMLAWMHKANNWHKPTTKDNGKKFLFNLPHDANKFAQAVSHHHPHLSIKQGNEVGPGFAHVLITTKRDSGSQ